METLLRASEAASDAFDRHWLKPWIEAHQARIKRTKTVRARKMAVAALAADIEVIIKELGAA